jgi:hypothetical protein
MLLPVYLKKGRSTVVLEDASRLGFTHPRMLSVRVGRRELPTTLATIIENLSLSKRIENLLCGKSIQKSAYLQTDTLEFYTDAICMTAPAFIKDGFDEPSAITCFI